MHTFPHRHPLSRQRGMGATVILFTIALMVLVGAALAYGSRGNSKAFTQESAKVLSSVLLKQSAEYRDAYNRYIFDGGKASAVLLDTTTDIGLFDPLKSYGIKQDPPLKAFEKPVAQAWAISKTVTITNLGNGAATIVYVLGVQSDVCKQINFQLYGDNSIPTENGLDDTTVSAANATMSAAAKARSTGCVSITSTTATPYMFYSTLSEG